MRRRRINLRLVNVQMIEKNSINTNENVKPLDEIKKEYKNFSKIGKNGIELKTKLLIKKK